MNLDKTVRTCSLTHRPHHVTFFSDHVVNDGETEQSQDKNDEEMEATILCHFDAGVCCFEL
jgi:hypothetical protein